MANNGSTGRGFDLVVRGGRILDPGSGIDEVADVGVKYGRIAAIGRNLPIESAPVGDPPGLGTQLLDASGKIVTPGFIDLHTHVYAGVCPLTVPADAVASRSGITTMVSAGDAGAYTIEGLRHLVADRSRTRILAFLHISRTGLLTWPKGEAVDIDFCDVDQAIRAVEENRDLIVGIKVRESLDVVGDNGLEPLRRALRVGAETGLPVMCHVGDTPTVLTEVLDLLRPGDIMTHCFTGVANNLIHEGGIVDGAHRALERGVVFDVGHGIGSFDFTVAERAFQAGIQPTTISTDINSLSATSIMRDLPTTMTKLLAVGMTLEEVIRSVTSAPARVMDRADRIGNIELGRVADLTVLEVVPGGFSTIDRYGNDRTADHGLKIHATIRVGVPWEGPMPHPSRSFAGTPGEVA